MHGSEAERECVLPGCVWSGPRPEELKALNVIIRAVGEPSSNHTQITYTLTPTYNTSHPSAECVRACVCAWLERRRGGIEKGRQNEGQEVYMRLCSLCCCKVCVCADKHVVAVRATRERVCVCVSPRKRGGCFFSPLFLPPSLLSTRQSYSISHPSIFHFYMQLQM